MPHFCINTQLCSKTLIIAARGYLNNSAGDSLVRVFSEPPHHGIKRAVLMLDGVPAANSVGTSHVLEIAERLKAAQGRLVLVDVQPGLAKTFTIMGLYAHALKADSVAEAMELLEEDSSGSSWADMARMRGLAASGAFQFDSPAPDHPAFGGPELEQ